MIDNSKSNDFLTVNEKDENSISHILSTASEEEKTKFYKNTIRLRKTRALKQGMSYFICNTGTLCVFGVSCIVTLHYVSIYNVFYNIYFMGCDTTA